MRYDSARRNVHSCSAARNPTRQDPMARSSTIRALERGLQVFKALQRAPTATLQDIHAATRIPKPSLLRILGTLEHEGMIYRRLDDGRYRTSTKLTHVDRKPDP